MKPRYLIAGVLATAALALWGFGALFTGPSCSDTKYLAHAIDADGGSMLGVSLKSVDSIVTTGNGPATVYCKAEFHVMVSTTPASYVWTYTLTESDDGKTMFTKVNWKLF